MMLIKNFSLIFLLICWAPAQAVDFPDKPSRVNFFTDTAGLLKPEDASTIDAVATKLLVDEKIPIYVVTIPSLASQDALTYSIEQYASELFNNWGIGFEDRNYGMLLLVSVADRKARIELGKGWSKNYDSQAEEVMNSLIIPAFKRGDFSTGIADGVKGMDAMARGLQLPKATPPWWYMPLLVIGVIGFVMLIINLFKTGRSGWAWALLAALGVLLFFVLRSAASGSGGGFGGGSSGGGGATGSW